MPYRRGPPRGSNNRLKHGRYTAAAIAERKLVKRTIRSARLALVQALIETLPERNAGHRWTKVRNFTTFAL